MTFFSRVAEIRWEGDVQRGSGQVTAGTGSFAIPVTFPRTSGDPPGLTTPEELLAASHATCFGIGLRSVIARHGGRAERIVVSATITADKGSNGIEIRSAHLSGVVEGLADVDERELTAIGREVAEGCTISAALRPAIHITHDVRAGEAV